MSSSADFVTIYEGPTPFAEALQAELKARGIGGIVQSIERYPGGIFPHSTVPSAYSCVRISEADRQAHPDEVAECLAFFAPTESSEDADYSNYA